MQPISLEEAQNLLFRYCNLMEKETVSLDHALERVLGETVKAKESIPPFARSPYDGYAIQAEDTTAAAPEHPAVLEVIEEVPAGYVAKHNITPGKAVKVSTGAPVPEGADAVIPYEQTELEGGLLHIFKPLKAKTNIVPMGEDIRQGECVAPEGCIITPPLVGIFASLGIKKLQVYRIPKIAILSIGDELMDLQETLAPGKIRNSNSYTLAGYCRRLGIEPLILGTARDRVEEVAELLEKGLGEADLVISTGGASVGDYDVTGRAYQLLQAQILYQKLGIKPGSPAWAAVKNSKILIGLSGNPAASAVVFQLLAVPFLKKMAGRREFLPQKAEVTLKENFMKSSPTRRFLRGRLDWANGLMGFAPTGAQSNGVLRSLISCDALLEIPAGRGPVMEGERLMAYLI